MTGLWVAAAVMSLAAAAAVLVPLMRRRNEVAPGRQAFDMAVFKDQLDEIERDRERGLLNDAEAEAARVEIQRRMLAAAERADDDPGAARRGGRAAVAAAGILVPAAAFGLYAVLGQPSLPDHPFAARDIPAEIAQRQGKLSTDEVTQLAARLESRLESAPGDAGGWVLLARTYLTIDAFDKAIAAYQHAMTASGGAADIAAGYGEALVLKEKGRVAADARALFETAVTGDPYNPKARYYLGLGKAQGGDLRGALQAWVDLRALSPEDAAWRSSLDDQILRAARDLGVAPSSLPPSPEAQRLAAARPAEPAPQTPPATGQAAAAPPPGPPGPTREQMEAASEMSAAERTEMIRGMVQRLADRLEDNPDDEAGWRRLARAYEVLGETDKAKDALGRADALAAQGR